MSVSLSLGRCKPDVKETAYSMLVRPKLEYASPYGIHTPLPKLNILKRYSIVQPDLSKTAILGWPTLERRRIIKQAMTFYKMLNNIFNIIPPPGLLKPWKNRGYYIATRCHINTAVFSFYPRAIRIWYMIPPHITEIENPIVFQAAIINLPFTIPNHLNCL